MQFKPKTEKEIAEEKLLPKGEYPFVISGAEDKISKAGNEMIVLTVRVFKPDGNFVLVTDFLMESMAYKLRHCAEACGLIEDYEAGNLNSDDLVGKEGYLKLGIQVDKAGQYPDKNNVADYITEKDATKPGAPKKDALDKALSGDGIEDSIPW